MDEINVKIIEGITGQDCDIDVPLDATIGDVLIGLVNEGFISPDNQSGRNVLYNKDGNQGTPQGVKYDDRNKTVKEYGWQSGQSFAVMFDAIAG